MKIYDFSRIEEKWQKKWKKEGVFEANPDKRKKFFITTPYPYISGSLHLGHARATTETDIYSRYLRMKGYNVLYPLSFHITGTPVLGISSAIENGDKKMIELYEGYVRAYEKDEDKVKKIVKSFIKPEKVVDFFIPKMIEEYQQLGLGVDWRRSFTSGDFEHQEMVKWQFEKYHERGYLKQGEYPVLYSPQDESAMGEDDIKDGDADPVEKQEFTLIKYRLGKKFLVAATIRPETIFGQTNLWVNPKNNYVEVKVGKETWIVSSEAADKLSYQKKITFVGKTTEKLIGECVEAPIIGRKLPILPARFVDGDIGTGVVTSVPSDAPYDYVALTELQENSKLVKEYGIARDLLEEIEVIPIIKTRLGDKSAVSLVEKHGIVLQDDSKLEELTKEVYKEGFNNGVLLDLCKGYEGMSVKEAKEAIKKDLLSNGGDIMYETSRKAFSRSGGKIVVAVLDGQWFIDFNSSGWKDKAYEALRRMTIVPESMRKQFEDNFAWLDKRPAARRRGLGTEFPFDKNWIIESLSDSTVYMTLYTISNLIKKHKLGRKNLTYEFFDYVYLGKGDIEEVSKKTKVSEKILDEFKDSFEYWMPVNHRHTFALHLSNHLSFMIFSFAALFPQKYWPQKITFHGLVLSEGSKMSKSKGNVVTLLYVKNKYGADVFRFYLTQSSTIEGTFDWKESEVETAKSSIGRLILHAQEGIALAKKTKNIKVRPLFVSKFNRIIKEASEKIDSMKLREYDMLVVHEMLNLVREAHIAMPKEELASFYDMIMEDWIKMLAPVTPHLAEELWNLLGKKGFVSLAEWPNFDEGKIDDKLEEQEKFVDKIVGDVMNILKIVGEKGKDASKVYLYVLPNELSIYDSKLLTKRIGKDVRVFAVNDKSKYDPEGKSSKVKPGRPGVYVE